MKYLQDEKGLVIVPLPIAGTTVSLRPPKGRDLATIERAAKDQTSNIEIMAATIAALASPQMTADDILDLDAEDLMSLGEALNTFRVLRNS